jgi:predicted dehydrogenase
MIEEVAAKADSRSQPHRKGNDERIVNIGILGYGYWGPNLVRNFAETPGMAVAAVADLDSKKLELVQRRYPGVKTTTHFQDILQDPTIDAVALATPVSTHFELGMAALRAGKHLWVEKPMTESLLQALKLRDEAAKRKRTVFVDHTFIYTGAIRRMAELVKSGELGNVYYYDSTRINLGLFQRDVNVISDLAVHDFSILDHLLGEHPSAVSASGINHFPGTPENLAYLTLFYDSGTIAHVNVSWLAPVKVRQILIGGSKRMIIYDDLQPSEKVKIYDKGISFTEDPKQIYEMRVGYRTGDMWAPKLDNSEALKLGSEHFLDCLKHGKTPETDADLGVRVVELIEAATSSMRGRGETVYLQRQGKSK